MKHALQKAKFMKTNLIESFNPAAFKQMQNLNENWAEFVTSFEFISFMNLLKFCYASKEIEMIEKHFDVFRNEAVAFVKKRPAYLNDKTLEIEIPSYQLKQEAYLKYIWRFFYQSTQVH